jgi:hypothetical protein
MRSPVLGIGEAALFYSIKMGFIMIVFTVNRFQHLYGNILIGPSSHNEKSAKVC